MVVTLGIVVFYMYFLAPKFNPDLKAQQLLNDDRIDEAIVEYRKILEKYPLDVAMHFKLAKLYLQLENSVV